MPSRNYSFDVLLYENDEDIPKSDDSNNGDHDDEGRENERADSSNAKAKPKKIAFFAFDSNGAQFGVRAEEPGIEKDMRAFALELEQRLQDSDADAKIVFAHHPVSIFASTFFFLYVYIDFFVFFCF